MGRNVPYDLIENVSPLGGAIALLKLVDCASCLLQTRLGVNLWCPIKRLSRVPPARSSVKDS